jgi:predicted AAA+ superfamily ATPase
LQKYYGTAVHQRGSSPKLLALNTALVSALSGKTRRELRDKPDAWGRLVETAVGAHLVGGLAGTTATVSYWRHRNDEVDFILDRGDSLTAIEVKSGRRSGRLPGLQAFRRRNPNARPLLVGTDGVPLEEFLLTPAHEWV